MDSLRNYFRRLQLTLIGEPAVRFIDPVVFSICLPLWDTDGDGFISEDEAKKTQRFVQGIFNGKDDIISLDDLDKVGGYIYHAGNFDDIPNLVTASTGLKINFSSRLPDTVMASYMNCPKLKRIKIDKHITEICTNAFRGDIALTTVIFGGHETKLSNACFYGLSLIHI